MFTRNRQSSIAQSLALFFILLLASVGLYYGWRLFWFLTDDAFIAFRYVSNSILGFGYTWNLPPFRPVEGYTSFLWVVLLDIVWRATGIEPPDSANTISLLFAYGITFLGIAMLLKMRLRSQLHKIRLLLLALVLSGVLTNRTYLTWTSSGLETAMFNFFVTAWVFSCLFVPPSTPRWLGWMTLTAVLIALTRPDGLLFIAATLLLNVLTLFNRIKEGYPQRRYLLSLTPLLITVAHLLWRKYKYGEWLPNTHAAKSVAIWPESGLRYLLSFIIEYTLWFWIAMVLLFLLTRLRNLLWRHPTQQFLAWLRDPTPTRSIIVLTVVGTLVAHFAYYTIIIGGDHFEYRIYSHLILFVFLSSVWLLNALNATAPWALVFLGLLGLCALPIPWTYWTATRDLFSLQEKHGRHVPIASRFPPPLRPYVSLFDSQQSWLIEHYVGESQVRHKVFYEYQTRSYPPRSIGISLLPDNHLVMIADAVGVPGWVLPTTNIIDAHGLNDYVIARNPVDPGRFRKIAHERYPPVNYVECFQPNVKLLTTNKFVIAQRELTADVIVACENREWPPGVDNRRHLYRAINLGIDSVNAPAVDSYIWGVWPSDMLYLYFVPPEQDSTQLNTMLLDAFSGYAGLGCVVIPPVEQLVNRSDYLFSFLSVTGQSDLPELAVPLPWTQVFTERIERQSLPYHLGYTALAGPEAEPQPDQPRVAVWTNQLRLLGYDLPRTSYQPGETIYPTLYYHVGNSLSAGYSIFTHLLGTTHNPTTAGPLWGQDDGDLCHGLYPMERWQSGSIVVGKMAITIPLNAPSGDYKLVVGFYDRQTGERVLLSGEMAGKDGVDLASVRVNIP